ncbi:MAG: hypothetical protein MHPSP_002948, partial [Paramarteilia canceri]
MSSLSEKNDVSSDQEFNVEANDMVSQLFNTNIEDLDDKSSELELDQSSNSHEKLPDLTLPANSKKIQNNSSRKASKPQTKKVSKSKGQNKTSSKNGKCEETLEKMINCYEEDIKLQEQGKPGINKLNYLSTAMEVLNNCNVQKYAVNSESFYRALS